MGIVRNEKEIKDAIFRTGMIIFVVNGKNLNKVEVIQNYKNRDKIKKDIDSLKNQIDGKRLRAHNKYTSNGRLFVKFIALIQHSKIMNIIKNDEKLKKYSLCEIMSELKKLKRNCLDENNTFLSELTKNKSLFLRLLTSMSIVSKLPGY